MEPQMSSGSLDVFRGWPEGRQLQYFGLYGNMAPPTDNGSSGTPMAVGGGVIPGFMSSLYPVELAGMAEEEPLDRATEAARNHREAEKRRRERIKYHLDRLRTILACDPKIDKASLLAKAVEHVRDLKQRAAEIGDMEHFPTETDEISVYPDDDDDRSTAPGRRPIMKASLCCEDRSGLLPELAETLKSLHLRILRAEIATLGGRVRNVLVVTGDDAGGEEEEEEDGGGGPAGFLKDALRALVERPLPGAEERPKRRRVSDRSTTTA
uniref:Putative transcription factor bHLH107 n=1 Tax=Anthurium amnicola TaxID=1678845 RepID=A0A1D1YAF7_9ARAE